jgi:hypothetical protein
MLSEDERERMRRAYYIDHLKMSQIARDTGHCRQTVKNVIEGVPRKSYQLRDGRPGPRFQPFQKRLEELLAENETLPPKQPYTTHKLFEILCAEGYQGCESRLGQFRTEWKQANYPPEVFLPLEFGVITFFRTIFPAKQKEIRAGEEKEAFPTRICPSNTGRWTFHG